MRNQIDAPIKNDKGKDHELDVWWFQYTSIVDVGAGFLVNLNLLIPTDGKKK